MKTKQIILANTNQGITERELKNRQIAYDCACEAVVLLKNNNCLPLKDKKIALFGAGARQTIKGGTGSGEVNERYSVSIYSGLLNDEYIITTNKWLDDYDEEFNIAKSKWTKLKMNPFTIFNDLLEPFVYPEGRLINDDDITEDCNLAIYVASRQAGEGGDMRLDSGDYHLLPNEIENLKYLKEKYQQVVLIINSGSSMDLQSIDNLDLDAIIFASELGCEGGNAIASILSGKVSPSGRLTDTWAKKYEDIPYANEFSYLNGDTTCNIYKEDIYVGYRYFDTFNKEVRYPFGYGLSYTNFAFEYSNYQVSEELIEFDCKVTNIGEFASKEVIQVYVSLPSGKLKKEAKRLVSYAKTKVLAKNESQTIHLSFSLRSLASYLESEASYILEKGLYVVRAGKNVNYNEILFAVRLGEDHFTERLLNLVKPQVEFERLEPVANEEELPENLTIIDVDSIEEKEVEYYNPEVYKRDDVDKILTSLSTKEKVELCVGMGIGGMLNSEGYFLPGTVGKTTTKLTDKGIINMNLCDGPAGIRILKESALNKKGKLKMIHGNYIVSAMQRFPKWLISALMAKKNAKAYYQYATAFPVGIAMAQTFNQELCYEFGKAVSEEMSEFGCTYWLAPALNIHRNPLCGRNFEYFSEDPVVSGLVASNICKGIASIPGNYATIKHFACNNCEDNRQHSNSILSERALREIYLKGFEICVKNADVKALMSSYNLINGTYAGNTYALNNSILRCEWGYDGLVMTDWFETGKGKASDALAIKSGIDLIMPGSNGSKKDILKGLRKGIITNDDLDRSCANIIRYMLDSRMYKKEE